MAFPQVVKVNVTGARGIQGVPGGSNATYANLTAVSASTVPSGTNLIFVDNGNSYIYDAAVDADFVTANPLTSVRDLAGRGFRLADLAFSDAGTAVSGDSARIVRSGVTMRYDLGAAILARPTSATLAASGGSALVGFQQSGTSPIAATAQAKQRQILSAADFTGFDATGVSASTTAVQNALNEASARGKCDVIIPNGAKIGALTIPTGVTLMGPEARANLVADTGGYTTFTLNASDSGIQNIQIEESAKSSGDTFLIACGTTGKDRIRLENIVTFNSWRLLADSGSSNGVHTTTLFRNIQAKAHRGPGVAFTRQFAFVELDHVIIDYVGVSASDFTGFSFTGTGLPAGAGGLIIERCDVLGTMGTFTNANQIGCVMTDLSAVRIRNTRMDTCGNDGWRFNNINGLIMDDVAAGLCDGHGMSFTSCQAVIANKVFLFGRNYLTTPSASKDGIIFVSGNNGINIGNVLARDFTGHGINKSAAQVGPIGIFGLSAYANTGRGVRSTGSSGFLVSGYQFNGNTAGNYDLGGAFDYIMSGQLASGAVSTSIGPGTVTG